MTLKKLLLKHLRTWNRGLAKKKDRTKEKLRRNVCKGSVQIFAIDQSNIMKIFV